MADDVATVTYTFRVDIVGIPVPLDVELELQAGDRPEGPQVHFKATTAGATRSGRMHADDAAALALYLNKIAESARKISAL